MLTIAGGIILATVFLAAPGFFIVAGLLIGALILVVALIAGSWDWITGHFWGIAGFFLVMYFIGSRAEEKEKEAAAKNETKSDST